MVFDSAMLWAQSTILFSRNGAWVEDLTSTSTILFHKCSKKLPCLVKLSRTVASSKQELHNLEDEEKAGSLILIHISAQRSPLASPHPGDHQACARPLVCRSFWKCGFVWSVAHDSQGLPAVFQRKLRSSRPSGLLRLYGSTANISTFWKGMGSQDTHKVPPLRNSKKVFPLQPCEHLHL